MYLAVRIMVDLVWLSGCVEPQSDETAVAVDHSELQTPHLAVWKVLVRGL